MIVLIAEEQPILAMMLAWQLEEAGHRVLRPVATPQAAQALAAEASPDLALIDINLQGSMDRVALARTLQSRSKIPCVFITSHLLDARSNPDAALGVIRKPYSGVITDGAFDRDVPHHGLRPGREPASLCTAGPIQKSAGWSTLT